MPLDYSASYGGLTIGNGTVWQIVDIEGLEDLPAVRSGDSARSYAHGEVPGLDLLAGRDITISMQVFDSGAGDFAVNVERLKAITVPSTVESMLTFQLPGRNPRTIMCRPRRRDLRVDPQYSFRMALPVIQFHATDPRIYDSTTTSGAISLPSASTGLTFNATAPFVFGSAGTGGSLAVVNSGNFPAPWVAQIAGPVTNPVLTLAATGQSVTFNGTVNTGETLVVDSLARSVLLGGTASRYSWVSSTSVFFDLPVGSSSVQFGATSGTGTCTFSYRSVWV